MSAEDVVDEGDAVEFVMMGQVGSDAGEEALVGVGEGSVADVVQKGGESHGEDVVGGDVEVGLGGAQMIDEETGDVTDADGVLEAGVVGGRIDVVYESGLVDVSESLEVRSVDDAGEGVRDGDEAVDGVGDSQRLPSSHCYSLSLLQHSYYHHYSPALSHSPRTLRCVTDRGEVGESGSLGSLQ